MGMEGLQISEKRVIDIMTTYNDQGKIVIQKTKRDVPVSGNFSLESECGTVNFEMSASDMVRIGELFIKEGKKMLDEGK